MVSCCCALLPHPLQVTTLLGKKEEEAGKEQQPTVSPEQLKALQEQVTAQGTAVKEAKAVSRSCARPTC